MTRGIFFSPWSPLFIQLALSIAGMLLWRFPSDPDVLFGFDRLAGSFLLFLFFAHSLWHWGKRLVDLSPIREKAAAIDPLLFGSAFLSIVAGVLGTFGGIGPGRDWIMIGILFAGPILGTISLSNNAKRTGLFRLIETPVDRIALLLISADLLCRTAFSFLPHGTSDPFLYHLLAPRIWWQEKGISLPRVVPQALQASYWEYLNLWSNALMAGEGGRGLIEGHLFGQWLHTILGYGGTIFALWTFLKRTDLFKVGARYGGLIAFAAVLSSEMVLWTPLPKHDWGAFFWSIGALTLLFQREALLGGLFCGLAVAAKWNMALVLAPAALYFVFTPGFQYWTFISAGALLVVPILGRNLVLTGNPFFPLFGEIFSSPWMPRVMSSGTGTFGRDFSLKLYLLRIFNNLWSNNFISTGLLLVPFCRGLKRSEWALSFASIFPALVFFLGRFQFARWIGLGLILPAAIGMAALLQLVSRLVPSRARLRGAITLLPVILITIQYFWKIEPQQRGFFPAVIHYVSPTYLIRNDIIHIGGSSKSWLRMNSKPGDLIISTGDDQLYYLSNNPVRVVQEDPELARESNKKFTGIGVLELFLSVGGKYLLDTDYWSHKYWTREAFMIDEVTDFHPEAVLHEGKRTKVVDIRRLLEESTASCYP